MDAPLTSTVDAPVTSTETVPVTSTETVPRTSITQATEPGHPSTNGMEQDMPVVVFVVVPGTQEESGDSTPTSSPKKVTRPRAPKKRKYATRTPRKQISNPKQMKKIKTERFAELLRDWKYNSEVIVMRSNGANRPSKADLEGIYDNPMTWFQISSEMRADLGIITQFMQNASDISKRLSRAMQCGWETYGLLYHIEDYEEYTLGELEMIFQTIVKADIYMSKLLHPTDVVHPFSDDEGVLDLLSKTSRALPRKTSTTGPGGIWDDIRAMRHKLDLVKGQIKRVATKEEQCDVLVHHIPALSRSNYLTHDDIEKHYHGISLLDVWRRKSAYFAVERLEMNLVRSGMAINCAAMRLMEWPGVEDIEDDHRDGQITTEYTFDMELQRVMRGMLARLGQDFDDDESTVFEDAKEEEEETKRRKKEPTVFDLSDSDDDLE